MEFLDLVEIGKKVKVTTENSHDRLSPKTLEILKKSSTCIVRDFRLTDGKGIGLVLELANGENEWFFENEIEIIDEKGEIIERNKSEIEKGFSISDLIGNFNYEQKTKAKDLLNPFNLFSWLIFSVKDII